MEIHTETPAGERLLKLRAVSNKTGAGRSKIYDLIDQGRFPKPIKVDGMSLWPESAIDRWISEAIAGRMRGETERPQPPKLRKPYDGRVAAASRAQRD